MSLAAIVTFWPHLWPRARTGYRDRRSNCEACGCI